MSKQIREIIIIDEDLCDGCGDCVPSCVEGAIQIIDGKAKLVADNLCDGIGNCLGTCPQGAITIEKREAENYDEKAVEKHLHSLETDQQPAKPEPLKMASMAPSGTHATHAGHGVHTAHGNHADPGAHADHGESPCGCPGSAMRSFDAASHPQQTESDTAAPLASTLSQWPIQIMLVPPTAPFLKGRELLLAADCVPFAHADFHRKFLKGKSLLVGCPKLDDVKFYREKLEEVFRQSGCTAVTVMIMEVPCCTGLSMIAQEALNASGADIVLNEIVIGLRGDVLREQRVA
jgi:NAD-dependent dihydropyrimidine dehydrogenase PreA subunit